MAIELPLRIQSTGPSRACFKHIETDGLVVNDLPSGQLKLESGCIKRVKKDTQTYYHLYDRIFSENTLIQNWQVVAYFNQFQERLQNSVKTFKDKDEPQALAKAATLDLISNIAKVTGPTRQNIQKFLNAFKSVVALLKAPTVQDKLYKTFQKFVNQDSCDNINQYAISQITDLSEKFLKTRGYIALNFLKQIGLDKHCLANIFKTSNKAFGSYIDAKSYDILQSARANFTELSAQIWVKHIECLAYEKYYERMGLDCVDFEFFNNFKMLRELLRRGPAIANGYVSKNIYTNQPSSCLPIKIGQREVVGWAKGSIQTEKPPYHTVILVGTEAKENDARQYVFFVDPDYNEGACPEKEPIYKVSFERICNKIFQLYVTKE